MAGKTFTLLSALALVAGAACSEADAACWAGESGACERPSDLIASADSVGGLPRPEQSFGDDATEVEDVEDDEAVEDVDLHAPPTGPDAAGLPHGWPLDPWYGCADDEYSFPGHEDGIAECRPLERDHGYLGFEPDTWLTVGGPQGDHGCSQAGLVGALDAARVTSGTVGISVDLACDEIVLTQPIHVPSRTLLDGNGVQLVLQGVVGTAIRVLGENDVVFRDFTVDATDQRHQSNSGETNVISVWGTNRFLAERLLLYGGIGSGLIIGAAPGNQVRHFTVRYSETFGFPRHGIGLNPRVEEVSVHSNYMHYNALHGAKGGLNLDAHGLGAEVAGNWMSDSGIRGAKLPYMTDAVAHDNIFVDNRGDGLFVYGPSRDFVVRDNYFARNGGYDVHVNQDIHHVAPRRMTLLDNDYASPSGHTIGIGFSEVHLCGHDKVERDLGRVHIFGSAQVSSCP